MSEQEDFGQESRPSPPPYAMSSTQDEYAGMTFYELCCLVVQKDAEIATLKADKIDQLTRFETAKLHDAYAEIAALREAVRDIDSFIGTSAENQLREWHRWEKLPAVRRAREEKP